MQKVYCIQWVMKVKVRKALKC